MHRKFSKIFFLFFIVVLLTGSAIGQELQFDHLSSVDELANRSITAITQDSKGFIWFGTQDGLLRYDGYGVKVYKNEINNKNSLSDNNIRDIKADKKGNLWIATQGGGLNKLILSEERFVHYKQNPNDKNSISGNAIWKLLVDSLGNVWAGSWSNGLNRLDVASGKFDKIATNSPDPVLAIYKDKKGGVWFASQGLSYYDPATGNVSSYASNSFDSTTLSSNNIRGIAGDKNGVIWVATDNAGLNKFDPNTKKFERFYKETSGLNSNAIYDIKIDDNGLMWLATNNGLNVWDTRTNQWTYYTHDPTNLLSLSNNSPRVIFTDRAGAMWIGNEGGRINKTIDKKAFYTYDMQAGLSNNLIRSIYGGDDGEVWIGTQGGGLNILDRSTGEIRLMSADTSQSIHVTSSEISAIYKDQQGAMWIGTWGNGIYRLDYLNDTTIHYVHDNFNANSLPDDRIQMFHIDKSGVFWIGTENGLSTFDQYTNTWTPFTQLNSPTVQGQAFIEQEDGTLWIGTWNGLNKVSPDRSKVISWPNEAGDETITLTNEHVISLHLDKNNVLWIGTFGGGLNKYDLNTGEVKGYTEKDGLPNGVIYGIREDEEGNLWMSTNNGLSRFSPGEESFRNYDKTEGLQGNEFYWGAAAANADGSLMFGGVNGLNIFYPSEIQDNKQIPPVVISDFQIYNKPVGIGVDSVLQKSITYTNALDLSYRDAVLTFSFAALNYNHPEKNQYAYMLEGFDETWNYVGNKHTTTYTNLDPGDYVFKVKGSNNDNIWNETGTSLAISISPPFWRTWWFYGLVGLIGFGAVRTVIKRREQTLEQDKQVLKQKIEEAQEEVRKQQRAIEEQREQEKERIWKDQGLVQLGEVLSRSKDDIKILTNDVLKALVQYLEIPAAAIYVAQENEEGEEQLDMIAHYGYPGKKSFNIGAGLVGECFKEREANYVDNLPADYLKLESGLGAASPGSLFLVPLLYEDIIIGVMELASFKSIPEYRRDFVMQFSVRLTTAINTTLLGEQTKKLLEESKFKEEELKVREEELQQNLEEMQAINEDRDRRTKELEERIEALQEEIKDYKKQLKAKS